MPPQGQAYQQPPSVRFDAIGEAWNLVKQNMATWIVSMLLYSVIAGVLNGLVQFVLSLVGLLPPPGSQNPNFSSGYFVGMAISILASLGLSAFFTGGLLRMAAKQAKGQDIAIGDLFSASDVLLPMLGVVLLTLLAVYAGALLCVVPGIIIGIRLYFAPFLVADQRMGAIDAMKRSWAAIQGHGLNLFLFAIVASLVSSLGLLACFVGILVTAPVALVAMAIVYRDLCGVGPAAVGPTLDMPLPPQSAYNPGQYPPPPANPPAQ
jgi:uncharacterized membrane protein